MAKSYISESIQTFREKFSAFFQHRKKIKALENYANTGLFRHEKYIPLLKGCLEEGFLEAQEATFLDHLVHKYLDDYLFWAHRTKSLKQEIIRLEKQKPKPQAQQLYIDFGKLDEVRTGYVPTHIIKQDKQPEIRRRA